MAEQTSAAQRVRGAAHVVTWVVDRGGNYMLWFRCDVCGDLTQRPCSNPRQRWGHWAQTYAKMHPVTPHER
jgi:hypothetical protein